MIEVFLVHPGGPYFADHDEGVWSIAKGVLETGESDESAARREFAEEVGVPAPEGEYIDLSTVRFKSGKIVHVFAVETPRSLAFVGSNTFELEWPKHSGTFTLHPECDRGEWSEMALAYRRLATSQHPFLSRLVDVLRDRPLASHSDAGGVREG